MADILGLDLFGGKKQKSYTDDYFSLWAEPSDPAKIMDGFKFDFTDKSAPGSEYLKAPTQTSGFDKFFDSSNIGSTLGGIGQAISGAAAIYNAAQTKKYQDKLFDMEKDRVDRANARQQKMQENYEKSKGWS